MHTRRILCLFPLCVLPVLAVPVSAIRLASAQGPPALQSGWRSTPRPALQEPRLGGPPLPGAIARLGDVALRGAGRFDGVIFMPKDDIFATCSTRQIGDDDYAELWDASTGLRLRRFPKVNAMRHIAISPDGRTLAGTPFQHIVLWDIGSGRQSELAGPADSRGFYAQLAFSPDGQWLAVVADNTKVLLYDYPRRRLVRDLTGHQDPIEAIAFSPDSKCLAVTGGQGFRRPSTTQVWRVAAAELQSRWVLEDRTVMGLDFSPDGKVLAGPCTDRVTRLWDPRSGKVIGKLPLYGAALAFSPDGRTLALADPTGVVHFFSYRQGKETGRLRAGKGPLTAVAYSHDGSKLVTTCRDESSVGLWKIPSGEPVVSQDTPVAAALALAFSPDGKTLACRYADSTLRLWDVRKRDTHYRLRAGAGGVSDQRNHSALITPDGRLVLALVTKDAKSPPHAARAWDVATGNEVLDIAGGFRTHIARAMALAPDGAVVALCGDEDTVDVWSVPGNKRLARLIPPQAQRTRQGFVETVAFSPVGDVLAVADRAGAIRFWDWRNERVIGNIRMPGTKVGARPLSGVGGLAFSRTGEALMTCSGLRPRISDPAVRCWDLATGEEIRALSFDRRGVASVALSPDGTLLAAGASADGTIRVWNRFTGKLLTTFDGQEGAICSLRFSPDGKLLASASADTTIVLWDVGKLERRPPAEHLDAGDLELLWQELGTGTPAEAYAAAWRMTAGGARTVAFLDKRIPRADK